MNSLKPILTPDQEIVYAALKQISHDGKNSRGSVTRLAKFLHHDQSTISKYKSGHHAIPLHTAVLMELITNGHADIVERHIEVILEKRSKLPCLSKRQWDCASKG
jgi:hypothetical protein